MKFQKKFVKAFGLNEISMIDFPKKISSTKISRIRNKEIMGGCSYCYPHGFETINSKYEKDLKCWKRYRKNQWKN